MAHVFTTLLGLGLGCVLVATAPAPASSQHGTHGQKPADHGAMKDGGAKPGHGMGTDAPRASRRITMEELHAQGGVPRGWRFTLPAGDPKSGRQVFADLECYKCHTVKGEGFPPAGGDPKNVGPELTGMGAHHPPEYFAESILEPNAVLVDGPGWIGPDGRSVMPSYTDSLSLTQLIDLVAFLRHQGGGHGHGGGGAEPKTVGDYTVRLDFVAGGHGHGHAAAPKGGSHGHGTAGQAGARAGHLTVVVADRETGEPVPYLPVTATVRRGEHVVSKVTLAPMMGGRGFHYGADVSLPSGAHRVEVAIGKPTMRVMASAQGRYAAPVTAVFELAP